MSENGEAQIGELDEGGVDDFGGDDGIAPIVGPLARRGNHVGVAEIRGLALGRSVQVHLYAADFEVVRVLQGDFVLRCDFVVEVPHGESDHIDFEQAPTRGFGDQRVTAGGCCTILDGGNPLGEDALLTPDQLVDLGLEIAFGQGEEHPLGRGFLEHAVGLIGTLAPPDDSARRVRCLGRVTEEFETGTVGRSKMARNMGDDDGVFGGGAVQGVPVGVGSFLEQAVIVSPPQNGRAGRDRIVLDVGGQGFDDVVVVSHGSGGGGGHIHHVDHGHVRGEVAVSVDEAGHQGSAAQVDALGLRTAQSFHRAQGAGGNDLAVANREGFDAVAFLGQGQDRSALEDRVRRD